MSLYFFHLASPEGYSRDEVGTEFANVEAAYFDAAQAALEISIDAVKRRENPAGCRFEVFDRHDRLIFELSFEEVLAHPRRGPPAALEETAHHKMQKGVSRNRALSAEMAGTLQETYRLLARTKALLGS